MNLFYQEPYAQIIQGDSREVLPNLPAESVQMCVTSPPYWGKRKYAGEQELIWGGDNSCEHEWVAYYQPPKGGRNLPDNMPNTGGDKIQQLVDNPRFGIESNFCSLCGAWKGAYGNEPTPEMYVKHTIEILRVIKYVLRKDGVVFWNIGDTYMGGGGNAEKWADALSEVNPDRPSQAITSQKHLFIKPKDLCLIPFRIAIAAQEDGWWIRRDIIWSKTNPKPESVTDRPTTSHDYILMLTKLGDYYWDREAIREPYDLPEEAFRVDKTRTPQKDWSSSGVQDAADIRNRTILSMNKYSGRNIRSVWTFPTQSFPDAHFAVFPDDLPEICIKAATPEVGCCSRCGAPWKRIITPATGGSIGKSWHDHVDDEYKGDHKTVSSKGYKPGETIGWQGWQPTCKCNADKVPSVVLDPFAGTGTTGKVAKMLGRKSILIDTSEKYCGMARKRIEKVALPMITPVVEYYPEAPDWF